MESAYISSSFAYSKCSMISIENSSFENNIGITFTKDSLVKRSRDNIENLLQLAMFHSRKVARFLVAICVVHLFFLNRDLLELEIKKIQFTFSRPQGPSIRRVSRLLWLASLVINNPALTSLVAGGRLAVTGVRFVRRREDALHTRIGYEFQILYLYDSSSVCSYRYLI